MIKLPSLHKLLEIVVTSYLEHPEDIEKEWTEKICAFFEIREDNNTLAIEKKRVYLPIYFPKEMGDYVYEIIKEFLPLYSLSEDQKERALITLNEEYKEMPVFISYKRPTFLEIAEARRFLNKWREEINADDNRKEREDIFTQDVRDGDEFSD